MNILLTGANGFIGRYLLAHLIGAGHHVVPAVRRPAETDRLLPAPASIAVDFNRDTRPEHWLPRLGRIDAVINCAGLLQGRPGESIAAIHAAAPKALFAACAAAGVRRVIQISAISAEAGAGTEYASTKREADAFLAGTDLDWVILRPSLVYGEGAYGGTALFRALAALPGAIAVIGKGDQVFQPIHIDDLTAAVLKVLDRPEMKRVTIDPVGPETLTLRQILVDLRRWLGFARAPVLEIPERLVRLVARFGDVIGGPINTTALRQLAFGNAGLPAPFVDKVGIEPRRWHEELLARPAQAQDRWHARLYFVRPLLRWTLAAMWIVSGLVGLAQPWTKVIPILGALGLSGSAAKLAFWISCIIDVAVGVLLLTRRHPLLLTVVQLALVFAYTVGLSYAHPTLWSDPLGPLLKNLPVMVAILALGAVENDR
jgi:uncharacterized protein YbjT (DUF2867 family)